jgi:hypothetical protein
VVAPAEGLQQGTGAEAAVVGPADGVVEDPGIGPVVDAADSAVVVLGGVAMTPGPDGPETVGIQTMEGEPKRVQLWWKLRVH